MLVRQRDPEHRAGQHRHDGAFNSDGFFRTHDADLNKDCEQRGVHLNAGCAINSGSTGDCPPQKSASRRKDADDLLADELR